MTEEAAEVMKKLKAAVAEQKWPIVEERWARMMRLAKAAALINGRSAVTSQDLLCLGPCLLRSMDEVKAIDLLSGTATHLSTVPAGSTRPLEADER